MWEKPDISKKKSSTRHRRNFSKTYYVLNSRNVAEPLKNQARSKLWRLICLDPEKCPLLDKKIFLLAEQTYLAGAYT